METWLRFRWLMLFILMWATAVIFCNIYARGDQPYAETFEERNRWGVGEDYEKEGKVENGVYDMLVKADRGIVWSTSGREFGNAVYQVDATQMEGPLDSGYGMMIRADETGSFYLLEVSADGFVWIGRCADYCDADETVLVNGDWFPSTAVNTGLEVMNQLQISADNANLTFSVNGQIVGTATDTTFARGDIGVLVETLGAGGVRVHFDNFLVTPIEE